MGVFLACEGDFGEFAVEDEEGYDGFAVSDFAGVSDALFPFSVWWLELANGYWW